MKNPFLTYAIILVLSISTILASSCGKDDSEKELFSEGGGAFEISEFTGNWEATSGGFLRISDNLWVDIVWDGGSVSLTVQSSGRCTFTINPVDREAYTASGKMLWGRYEGEDALAIEWDDSPGADDSSYFRFFELTDTTFNLGCSSECGEYDFNNNGTSEVADLNFEFIRI
jgi:hypothetical protein